DTIVFHAGTTDTDGVLRTSGGRVLGITATAPGLGEAIDKTYAAVDKIDFEGMYYRKDIAAKGVRKLKETGK
ncbi:MAG: phosphoribosylglycinamide synthetase C domain-containing protein, partial [Acidobacteriota bacterium]